MQWGGALCRGDRGSCPGYSLAPSRANTDSIQPGSPFLQSLRSRIGKRAIRTFIWSGANSHKARINAGHELAGFVDRLCSTESFRRVWCVTHSHGGNVALYALRDERFAARLAGIVFLGTPFLHIHCRDVQKFCQTFFAVLFFPFLLVRLSHPYGAAASGSQLFRHF